MSEQANRKEFLRIGKRIVVSTKGVEEYDLVPSKIYNLFYDNYSGEIYLEENGDFNLPEKIYHSEEDAEFTKRVLTYFHHTKKQTTGVLLNGVKGTGKTVMAKKIAIDSKLPVIIPDASFPTSKLFEFAKQFRTEVVFFLDEIEKTINTEKILTFLDGVEATSKKLVLMTSNTIRNLDENLFDRPSRIRYYRTFDNNNNVQFIKDILKDKNLFTEEEIDYIYDFINDNFTTVSIDNIMSIIEEITIFSIDTNGRLKKEELGALLPNLNIVKKDSKEITSSPITATFDFSGSTLKLSDLFEEEDDDEEDNDEDSDNE